jgi:hypothetical protein
MAARLVLPACGANIWAKCAGHGARRRPRETGRIWERRRDLVGGGPELIIIYHAIIFRYGE